MIWNLAPQIATIVVALLVLGLDYFWTDRRTSKFKAGRRWLIVVVPVAAVVGLVSTYRVQAEQELQIQQLNGKLDAMAEAQSSRERDTLKRLLTQVEQELDFNFGVLQLKGGGTFGLVGGLTKEPGKVELSLELLKAQEFHAFVPLMWGSDLKLLAGHGPEGEKAYVALLHFYQVLKDTQERESDVLAKLRTERRPDWRRSFIAILHDQYETLRAVLMGTGKAVVPVMKEFGLAKGVRP